MSDSGEWGSARWRIRRYIAVSTIVVTVATGLCLLGYRLWRFRTIGTLVPCLKTGQYEAGNILLRTTSVDSAVLLIAPIDERGSLDVSVNGIDPNVSRSSYRHTPGIDGLNRSGLDEWAQATGAVTYKYFVNNRGVPFPTAGRFALSSDESPDGRFINVLSSNSPRVRTPFFSFFFFGGGGGDPAGPFYHEVFDRETGTKIGGTYTLEYSGEPVNLSYCWEQQGKYIVYHDDNGRFLWVVPGPNHSSSETQLQHPSTGQQKREKSDN